MSTCSSSLILTSTHNTGTKKDKEEKREVLAVEGQAIAEGNSPSHTLNSSF